MADPYLPTNDGSSDRYRLTVTNGGTAVLTRDNSQAATDARRRTLVNIQRTLSRELQANPVGPALAFKTVPLGFGHYEDLPVFSPDSREWSLRLNASGATDILGFEAPSHLTQVPRITDSAGTLWELSVDNSGTLSVTDEEAQTDPQGVLIRADDASSIFRMNVDTNGIRTITNDERLGIGITTLTGVELTSPDGTVWVLAIDANGIETVGDDRLTIAGTIGRDEWPLVLADRYGVLYCVDTRWPPPIPGVSGAIGFRRRRGR